MLQLEVDGGVRTQRITDPLGASAAMALANGGSQSWYGGSVDVSVGRSWYLLFSLTRDNVGPDRTNLFYSSLVYRF